MAAQSSSPKDVASSPSPSSSSSSSVVVVGGGLGGLAGPQQPAAAAAIQRGVVGGQQMSHVQLQVCGPSAAQPQQMQTQTNANTNNTKNSFIPSSPINNNNPATPGSHMQMPQQQPLPDSHSIMIVSNNSVQSANQQQLMGGQQQQQPQGGGFMLDMHPQQQQQNMNEIMIGGGVGGGQQQQQQGLHMQQQQQFHPSQQKPTGVEVVHGQVKNASEIKNNNPSHHRLSPLHNNIHHNLLLTNNDNNSAQMLLTSSSSSNAGMATTPAGSSCQNVVMEQQQQQQRLTSFNPSGTNINTTNNNNATINSNLTLDTTTTNSNSLRSSVQITTTTNLPQSNNNSSTATATTTTTPVLNLATTSPDNEQQMLLLVDRDECNAKGTRSEKGGATGDTSPTPARASSGVKASNSEVGDQPVGVFSCFGRGSSKESEESAGDQKRTLHQILTAATQSEAKNEIRLGGGGGDSSSNVNIVVSQQSVLPISHFMKTITVGTAGRQSGIILQHPQHSSAASQQFVIHQPGPHYHPLLHSGPAPNVTVNPNGNFQTNPNATIRATYTPFRAFSGSPFAAINASFGRFAGPIQAAPGQLSQGVQSPILAAQLQTINQMASAQMQGQPLVHIQSGNGGGNLEQMRKNVMPIFVSTTVQQQQRVNTPKDGNSGTGNVTAANKGSNNNSEGHTSPMSSCTISPTSACSSPALAKTLGSNDSSTPSPQSSTSSIVHSLTPQPDQNIRVLTPSEIMRTLPSIPNQDALCGGGPGSGGGGGSGDRGNEMTFGGDQVDGGPPSRAQGFNSYAQNPSHGQQPQHGASDSANSPAMVRKRGARSDSFLLFHLIIYSGVSYDFD